MRKGYVHRDAATFRDYLPETSGNAVNGLGVETSSRPKPFFWHPADQHEFGDLQQAIIGHQQQSPEIAAAYSRTADPGPRAIEKSP